MKIETKSGEHAFEVQVYLNDLDPQAVRVELYADRTLGLAQERCETTLFRQLDGVTGGYVYRATVSAARPAADYTARVIPRRNGVAIPLEDTRILWQR